VRVAVLGAGAGGLATTVELSQAGCEVQLWTRNQATFGTFGSTIRHAGVLGEGRVEPAAFTTSLPSALAGVAAVLVSLPAYAHGPVFDALADLEVGLPVVLCPGGTGGALHLRAAFSRHGRALPPVAELSTLPYVARVKPEGTLEVTGRAGRLRCGALPGGQQAAKVAGELFASELEHTDVLASSLSNVNLVLHPPAALLSAAWVEATGGDFLFYVDAMTPGVQRVMDALDAERLSVALAYGHELPPLGGEMELVGTAPPGARGQPTAEAVKAGGPNRSIKAPSSLAHRYYREDFAFGLVPFLALARPAQVPVPVAAGLASVAEALLGPGVMGERIDAARLGITGLDREALLQVVRG
jgi:opine dehydrogenase